MKIGFFTDAYTPQIDGVVRAIKLYKQALDDLGHEVYIFAPRIAKNDYTGDCIKAEKDVFRFYAMDSVFIPGYPLAFPLSFKSTKVIPKLKLDIVHCHTPLSLGMLGDIVALLSNVPQVFTYHTYYSEYAKHYFNLGKLKEPTSKVIRKLEAFYCNRADLVLAPSDKLRDVLENKMEVETEVEILPTGIDLQEFEGVQAQEFRQKHGISPDKKVLLYVGRLGSEKNVEFLIRMLPQVLAENENTILLIAGDGKDKEKLQNLAENLGLKNKILFLGFLNRQETIKAFKASDVFVFASKTDTQGLVLSEAAAAGKPIVMIEDKGLSPLVIREENTFFAAEDHQEFASYVLKLLQDDNLYAKMAQKSREIANKFSIDLQAKRLVDFYDSLISYHRDSSWRANIWRKLNRPIDIPFRFNGRLEKFKRLFK